MSFAETTYREKRLELDKERNSLLASIDESLKVIANKENSFEELTKEMLFKDGFENISVTKSSGDFGADVIAFKNEIRYAIQCKNYSSSLGNTPVQEVNAGKTFYKCHVGVVMTNSTFTPGANELAHATGILLWDRTVLKRMVEDYN